MTDTSAIGRLRLRWDGTITAGNALTLAVLLVGVLIWGLRLEGRVDRIDESQVRAEQRVAADVALIRRTLERIEDRLNAGRP